MVGLVGKTGIEQTDNAKFENTLEKINYQIRYYYEILRNLVVRSIIEHSQDGISEEVFRKMFDLKIEQYLEVRKILDSKKPGDDIEEAVVFLIETKRSEFEKWHLKISELDMPVKDYIEKQEDSSGQP